MAADEAAQHIAKLRAVAENPLLHPSLRVEARLALKALIPPPKRKPVVEPGQRGYPDDPPEWLP